MARYLLSAVMVGEGWTEGDNIVVLKGVGSAARGFIGQFFQQLMDAIDSAAT